jgi:hypothetical protein
MSMLKRPASTVGGQCLGLIALSGLQLALPFAYANAFVITPESTCGYVRPAKMREGYVWSSGTSDSTAWVQYQHRSYGVLVSFSRNRKQNSGVEMWLHDAREAAGRGTEIPRFVRFSMESGEGDNIVAVDGVGSLQLFNDGKVGFAEGNRNYGSAKGLDPHTLVLRKMRDYMRIWIDDTAHCFPLDVRAQHALQLLYADSAQFLRNAEKIRSLLAR